MRRTIPGGPSLLFYSVRRGSLRAGHARPLQDSWLRIRSGRGDEIAPVTPPTPPDMRFSRIRQVRVDVTGVRPRSLPMLSRPIFAGARWSARCSARAPSTRRPDHRGRGAVPLPSRRGVAGRSSARASHANAARAPCGCAAASTSRASAAGRYPRQAGSTATSRSHSAASWLSARGAVASCIRPRTRGPSPGSARTRAPGAPSPCPVGQGTGSCQCRRKIPQFGGWSWTVALVNPRAFGRPAVAPWCRLDPWQRFVGGKSGCPPRGTGLNGPASNRVATVSHERHVLPNTGVSVGWRYRRIAASILGQQILGCRAS